MRLSRLGVTVVSTSPNDTRIGGYPMWAFLKDGTVVRLDQGFTGPQGLGSPMLDRWEFRKPVENLNDIAGISINYWFIPMENGVALPGYWLSQLPTVE